MLVLALALADTGTAAMWRGRTQPSYACTAQLQQNKEEEARLQEAWEAFQSKWIVVEPSEWNLNHQEASEFGPALKDVKLHARIMPCSDMHGAEC